MIGVCLISIIPFSFAEIEKGLNYDQEVLVTYSDGSQKIKYTSQPERILVNDQYLDFVYTDTQTHLILETGHGSVKLNKSTCSFDFYPKGLISGSPLFTDSIVSKMANNGTETWNEITQISNATCETYGSSYQLVAKKYAAGVGFVEYKYINTGSSFKTQLEATNLSAQTNKKFGFTQTIDLNRDTIRYGGSIKNLDNYADTTFNRTWLENNESKVLNFLNNIYFDFDLSFKNLKSISVYDPGLNKSKLSFNYLYNSEIILPNETLVIDPTYSSADPTVDGILLDSGTNNILDGDTLSKSTVSTSHDIGRYATTDVDGGRAFYEYDVSPITDGSTVTSATFTFETGADEGSRNGCEYRTMAYQPSVASDVNIWNSIGSGTLISSSCSTASATNQSVTFNSAMHTYIESQLSLDWVSFGIKSDTEGALDASYHVTRYKSEDYAATPDPTLEIIYVTTPKPNAIIDLSTTAIGQTTATVTFTAPDLNGESLINYMLNVTTPQASTADDFYTNSSSTTINIIGLTLGTGYTAQASAYTLGGANWTYANVLNFTTATFNPPGAPTLSAVALSDTGLRLTSVAGTAGDNSTIWYGIKCSLNGAAFSNQVTNSSLITRIYEITGLTLGDILICQWRDGSVDGWSPWSNNATDTLSLSVIQSQRTDARNDPLLQFINYVDEMGGIWFGLGVIPFAVMMIGFMAGKKTVRIFTLLTLCLMGIIHGSGYYAYPSWYWTLALLFGIGLVMGRQKSD